ncbi:MAG: ABC transporter ATP-binding protein/permease [Acidimicrobiia bacterium]|nr:ABC transporter ATP-binding protein/permease [Acidimicrobiia bacterium]
MTADSSEPNEDRSVRGSTARDQFWRLARLAGRPRWWFAAIAGNSALGGAAQAAVLLVIARVAAALTVETEDISGSVGPFAATSLTPGQLILIAFGLVGIYLVTEIITAYLSARLTAATSQAVRHEVLTRHAAAPWSVKARFEGSALVQLVTSNTSNAVALMGNVATLLAALATFATLLVSAIVINPQAALAIIVGVLCLLAVTFPFARVAKRQSRFATRLNRAFAAEVQAVTMLGREIQVFGVQDQSIAGAADLNERQSRLLFRKRLVNMLSSSLFRVAALVLIVVLLGVMNAVGPGNAASLAAVALILLRSVSAGQSLQAAYHQVIDKVPWIEQLEADLEMLDQKPMQDSVGTIALPGRADDPVAVRLDRVSFAYPDGPEVLSEISFDVSPGESIGIVGPSGAGKSSLAQLVLGLQRPSSGSIIVNDARLEAVDPTDWAQHVAYLPQESTLLSTSIAENIRFFRSWVTDADVFAAAEAAAIGDEIRRWEHGFDTQPGTLGSQISGGQRQRIAIARALAGRPGLLVLDEPTSALDVQVEQAITTMLHTLHGTATMLIIAHRLSTLVNCDRIAVLDNGRLTALGTPGQLGDLTRYFGDTEPAAGAGAGAGADADA